MHKFFDKKTGSGISVNEQLDKKLHKPIIKKFKCRKVYARFKDNIWTAGLAEIEFYNKLIQEWLDINDVLMYSTHNEGKSVIAERFIKTLKAKIYKR